MSKILERVKQIHFKLSVFIVPLMLSCMMTIYIFASGSDSVKRYSGPVYINCFLMVCIWLIGFIIHERRVLTNRSTYYIGNDSLISICILIVLFLYGIKIIWGNGYLSLHPILAVNSGTQHIDSLYHSSIAESSRIYFPAKYLVNNCETVRYHYLSHIIVGIISSLYRVPAFIAYNLIYPVIFLPLYFLSQLLLTLAIKEYFGKLMSSEKGDYICKSGADNELNGSKLQGLTSLDMAIIFIGNFGIFLNNVYLNYGVWLDSFILSESYMCANTFLFLFLALFFSNMQKCRGTFPLFIFLIAYTKISVGYALTVALISYLIFTNYKKLSNWLNAFLCGVTFLATYFMTTDRKTDGNVNISNTKLSFCSFAKEFIVGRFGYLGHIFLLSLPIIAITVLLVIIAKNSGSGIMIQADNGKQTSDNHRGTGRLRLKELWALRHIRIYICIYVILIITAIACFAPAMVLNIDGGSVAYFSFVIILPSSFILCAFCSCINSASCRKMLQIIKRGLPVLVLVWSIYASGDRLSYDPRICPDSKDKYDLYKECMNIREETKSNPGDYTIYMDDDAYINRLVEDKRAIPYYYSGLTGIPMINASYREGSLTYCYGNVPCTAYYYGFTPYGRMTYEEACLEALKLQKTTIIHVTSKGYYYDYLK